jgi:type IV pilus assembly protein PilQ
MMALLLASSLIFQNASPAQVAETLIDIDLKDADALDISRLLAEVGNFNLVADPEVRCRLTLKLEAVAWPTVLELLLKSCRLGMERLGKNVIRIASMDQLTRELEQKRKYEDEKKLARPLTTTYRRLAYARAGEIAPLVEKFLSPGGQVTFDERTNTLIITDVNR